MQHNISNYYALKSVLKSGKFEIKGDAIEKVASLLKWYDSLEKLIKEESNKKPVIKKIGGK